MKISPSETTVYCPQCLREVSEPDARFCPYDGAALREGAGAGGLLEDDTTLTASVPPVAIDGDPILSVPASLATRSGAGDTDLGDESSSDVGPGEDGRLEHAGPRGEASPGAPAADSSAFAKFVRVKTTSLMGTLFGGRYLVRGFVNKGATARVYLAQDLVTNDPVVVKLFAPSTAYQERSRERFLKEANAIMHIDHPNIVKILSVGEADGRPFIVMEALHGEPLGEYLRREGAMPVELALGLFRQATRGLSAAHASGVVHRDVKPDNLFLTGNPGAPDGLKVIDFGMAKTAEEEDPHHGLVLGTVEYMSPEQVLADPVDARTDVYSLGVVMFRALTGHLPFDVDFGVDLVAHQIFSPAPPLSWLTDRVDPRIESLILTAMRKHPDNRYPSMDALRADLERILGVTPGEPDGLPMRRDPDTYEPRTDAAREAASAISRRVGLAPSM